MDYLYSFFNTNKVLKGYVTLLRYEEPSIMMIGNDVVWFNEGEIEVRTDDLVEAECVQRSGFIHNHYELVKLNILHDLNDVIVSYE